MNEEIQELMDEEIISQIKALSALQTGSMEKSSAVDDISKLYKLRFEEVKNQDEISLHECECQLKEDQIEEQTKDRYFKVGIAAAEIVIPAMIYVGLFFVGLKFEEKGVVTSPTFKDLRRYIRPTKK